jgi:hypothetical protein
VPYTTCRPVYEQHCREHRYTVHRPVVQCYQVAVPYTTCRPVYEHHTREHRYTVHRPVTECYQVCVPYTVYRTVHEQHVRRVPVTCTRQVQECRTECRVGYRVENVETEKCVKVCGGEWQERREYCPGPVVTRCCKTPGSWIFDPCSGCSRFCPGQTVQEQVQCPGTWVCKKVWVPKEEYKTIKCCTQVCKPYTYTVQVPYCRTECYTTYRDECYTTCRQVPEQCVRYETRKRCYTVPEEKVCQVPYTTCRLVHEQHVRYETKKQCYTVPEEKVCHIP